MDKKKMGQFMAQLRREKGMTQYELAERLGVSDKSVSRWERDEGTPDLSLIPELADIFGVTSDEILRGERASERTFREEKESTASGNAERFKAMCAVALGGVFLALIAGMAVNFAFLRAYIGFFVGAAILLIAAVVQLIFTSMTISLPDLKNRAETVRLTDRFFGFAAVILGFLISLLTAGDPYAGLRWWAFLTYGGIFAAILFVLWAVIGSYVFGNMLREEGEAYGKNLRLRRNTVYIMLGAMAFTFLVHALATAGWTPSSLAEGTKFEDKESFVAYMEQDIPYNYTSFDGKAEPVDQAVYYNAAGEEISYEEAHTHTISQGDDSVTFVWLNEEAATFSYGSSLFPITVYTHDDFKSAEKKIERTNAIFAAAYILEVIAAASLYCVRRKRDE